MEILNCSSCRLTIPNNSEECVTVYKHMYHRSCFKCCNPKCQQILNENVFHFYKYLLFCESCIGLPVWSLTSTVHIYSDTNIEDHTMAHLAKDTLPPVMDKESLSKPYYSKDNNFNTVKVYDAPEKKHPLKPLPPTKEKSMFDTKDNKHSVVIPKKQSVSSLIKKNNKVNPNDFKNNGVADYLNQTKHCKRCQQKVYEAEKVSTAGSCWHKRCFRCNSCEKSLQMGQLSERNNEIFCNPCYARDFGPKGYGHGVGAGILTLTT